MGNSKIILELNEAQAKIIASSCEFLARIHLGQLDELNVHLFHLHNSKVEEKSQLWEMLNTRLRDAERVISALYGMSGGHPGIHSEKVPDTARAAFDIYRVLRHQIWQLRDGERCHACNDAQTPTQFSTEHSLPVCCVREEV